MYQFNIHVCRYVYSLWILNERRSSMDIDYITSHRYNYNTYKLMTNTWRFPRLQLGFNVTS